MFPSYFLCTDADLKPCILIFFLVKRHRVFFCGLAVIMVLLRYKNIQTPMTHSPGILKIRFEETFPGEL